MKSCRYHSATPEYPAERENAPAVFSERQDCFSAEPLSLALLAQDSRAAATSAVPEIPASMNILDCLPAAVVVVDGYGRISYFNHKSGEYFGSLEIGELWRDTIDRVFVRSGDEDEMITTAGYSLMLETEPMSDKKGQVLVFHDVSKSSCLKKIRDRYARLATLGELAAKLAHQVRTPLGASMLFFSNLRGSIESSSREYKYLEKGIHGLRHIEAMVADMLMFTSNNREFGGTVQVDDIIYALENEKEVISQQYDCEIIFEYKNDLEQIRGNLYALKSAIGNLIENAAQACKAKREHYSGEYQSYKGKIHIVITKADDNGKFSACIQVTDNGAGIDPQNLIKLVKPFYTTKSNGTGLGLAVVKSVVDSHAGDLQINSAIGEGTEVVIRLP